jgi:hypothetical protein
MSTGKAEATEQRTEDPPAVVPRSRANPDVAVVEADDEVGGRERRSALKASLATGLSLVVLVVGVIVASTVTGQGSLWPYVIAGAGVMVLSTVSFLSFFVARDMRHAIAASFVLTYFSVVSLLLFLPGIRESLFGTAGPPTAASSAGTRIITELTRYVGLIVSAYFVGSGIEGGLKARARK